MTHRLRRSFADIVSARTWRMTMYFLLVLLTGMVWSQIIIHGFAFGVGLFLLWVGIPILLLTLVIARWGAQAERRLLRWAFDVDIPSPYRPVGQSSVFGGLKIRAADPATWKDCVYLVLLLPLGVVWFTVTTTLWSIALGLVTLPIYYRFLPDGHFRLFEADGEPWVVVDTWWKAIVALLLGLLVALAVPYVLRACGRVHVWVARKLLGASEKAELKRRMLELEATRAQAVWSAEAERRRIERDLHDGAQARLVALAMDLGRARERLADDPQAAQLLVEQAHEEAKATIADLRNLARGIHPAVLTDRGLDAALSSLAARSSIPVQIDVDLDERPSAAIESIAYFVVAEALTNVAKHARATEAGVAVHREGSSLIVEVADNGVGGASLVGDGGLAGLNDRVAGVDGTLTVASPKGGPTLIRAELPCVS